MLFLSWSGKVLRDREVDSVAARCTVHEVRKAGVEQDDVRSINLLWNEERQRVMLIDFERVFLLKARPPRNVLGEITPNEKLANDQEYDKPTANLPVGVYGEQGTS
jgi:hypothetical protein